MQPPARLLLTDGRKPAQNFCWLTWSRCLGEIVEAKVRHSSGVRSGMAMCVNSGRRNTARKGQNEWLELKPVLGEINQVTFGAIFAYAGGSKLNVVC